MTTHETATRYPLSWPTGWPRTPSHRRQRARFRRVGTQAYDRADGSKGLWKQNQLLTVAQAIDRLQIELGRLGASREILSTNLDVRLDGLPRSGQREPQDPGAAVYFQLQGQPRCLACDRWDRVADNIAAIAAHIEAIRAVDRYGVGTLDQAFAGYAALPPSASDWRTVLGFAADDRPTVDAITQRYRERARRTHPDAGGSHDAMATLNAARDAALQALPACRVPCPEGRSTRDR